MERVRKNFGDGVNNNKQQNKIMADLIGRFFFKKTDNGNLIGEFSNNQDTASSKPGTGISTESADRIYGCEERECVNFSYHGTYRSTWQDEEGSHLAKLKITPKKTRPKTQYSLEWCEGKDLTDLTFVGEGMLCDGMLIGDYRQPTNAEKAAYLQSNP